MLFIYQKKKTNNLSVFEIVSVTFYTSTIFWMTDEIYFEEGMVILNW